MLCSTATTGIKTPPTPNPTLHTHTHTHLQSVCMGGLDAILTFSYFSKIGADTCGCRRLCACMHSRGKASHVPYLCAANVTCQCRHWRGGLVFVCYRGHGRCDVSACLKAVHLLGEDLAFACALASHLHLPSAGGFERQLQLLSGLSFSVPFTTWYTGCQLKARMDAPIHKNHACTYIQIYR